MADSRVRPAYAQPTAEQINVETTRPRQTAPERPVFGEVLAASMNVALTGAQVATSVMGLPELAAPIADAKASIAAIAGDPTAAPAITGAAGAGTMPGGELATMAAMQRESQVFNMQLLELQEQVQQENRRFTTLSNVLRAKHDTAKAAVSNIRS